MLGWVLDIHVLLKNHIFLGDPWVFLTSSYHFRIISYWLLFKIKCLECFSKYTFHDTFLFKGYVLERFQIWQFYKLGSYKKESLYMVYLYYNLYFVIIKKFMQCIRCVEVTGLGRLDLIRVSWGWLDLIGTGWG